jgi:homoserine O-acetyltransferase
MFKLGCWIAVLCLSTTAFAEVLLTEKKSFTINNFKTFNQQSIKTVTVGWESYGKLNKDKSNAILITHHFSGNSHAAGKYHPDDKTVGYWDSIIGPNKAIDTNKYFVLSVDTLANLSPHDPNVITTGPSSINPDTGKPYGLRFPVVAIRDFVNVQKALIDSLGIEQLHAVVGASMGSMQALEWATAYPDMVHRMISVIGVGQSDAWTTASLEHWARPIKHDPNWNHGDFYGATRPTTGLISSLMLITQYATHPEFINHTVNNHHPNESQPMTHIDHSFAVVDWLENRAKSRAQLADANHLLYLVRASQTFIAGFDQTLAAGLTKIKAKSLFLPAKNDLLLFPYQAKLTHDTLAKLGKRTEFALIDPTAPSAGHVDGLTQVVMHEDKIRAFLVAP